MERAAEIGLPVDEVPGWYDVDDAQSLRMLRDEIAGVDIPYLQGIKGATAAATRDFVGGLEFFRQATDVAG